METVPQLDFSIYPSQAVWFICAFALLYLSVRYVVVPKVESHIGTRAKLQGAELDRADSVYARVRDELLRHKASLDEVEERAQSLISGAVSEVAAAEAEALRLLDEEVCGMMNFAEEQLEILKESSREELASLSSGVAAMYYARISGTKASSIVENEATRLSAELYGESYD
ncbi:hypothetical protein [Anaplasma bovis]|uniref:hypothetical protein n=1 Tax=Anaplasma bovis TaxID=186733 RepID=UPI002FF0B434